MGIPLWRSLLFFFFFLLAALRLFPSDRQMGLYFSSSPVLENAEFHLARQYHQHPEDTANAARYFEALQHSGQYAFVDRLIGPLLNRDPENLKLLKIAADSHEARLELLKASSYWRRIVDLQPLNEDIRSKLLTFYINRKMTPEAVNLLQYLRKRSFASADELLLLADLLFKSRQTEASLSAYQTFLQRKPGDPETLLRIAQIYDFQGNGEEALKAYERLAHDNPAQPDLSRLYADELLKRGREEAALETLLALTKRFPDDALLASEAASLLTLKPLSPENMQWLEALQQRFPNQDSLTLLLGGVYLRANRPDQAILLLETPAAQTKPLGERQKLLADAYLAAGQTQKAKDLYQKLLSHLDTLAYASLKEQLLGIQTLESLNRYPEARERLAKALAQFPGASALLETGASINRAAGHPDEALAFLEKLQKKQPANHKLLLQMAEIYGDKGDYEKAGEKLVLYHEKTGGDYHSYHLLGDVFTARGDADGARRLYEKSLELLRGKSSGQG